LRILFVGNIKLSKIILSKIYKLSKKNLNNKILVISSKRDKFKSDFSDLASFCQNNKIRIIKTDNINLQNNIKIIKKFKPDIGFCVGWSQLIHEKIIKIPNIGFVGYHPSLLPQNRGRHPLIWALVLGLKVTGSTFFLLKSKADAGDIISQKKIFIKKNDDANSLYKKMIEKTKTQIDFIFKNLHRFDDLKIRQNLSQSNYWRKRNFEDGHIDWCQNAQYIINLTKALTYPYPGAHFTHNDMHYKVQEVKLVKMNKKEIDNIEPGKVLSVKNNGEFIIKCFDQCLVIKKIYPKPKIIKGEYL